MNSPLPAVNSTVESAILSVSNAIWSTLQSWQLECFDIPQARRLMRHLAACDTVLDPVLDAREAQLLPAGVPPEALYASLEGRQDFWDLQERIVASLVARHHQNRR